MNQNKKLLAGVGGVVVFALIIVAFIVGSKPKEQTTSIKGIDKCSANINSEVKSKIQDKLYGLIKSANDYNKQTTLPTYTTQIRDGSCTLDASGKGTGVNDVSQVVNTTTVIIDVPDAKQSWKVKYHWTTGSQKTYVDLGSIEPSCLPQDKLIYGDFNCEKIMSLALNGTDQVDPILRYMPYSGEGFDLLYDPNTKHVTAKIYIPPKEKDNQELLDNSKAIVPYWFSHRNLDINKYTVTYEIVYQDPIVAQ